MKHTPFIIMLLLVTQLSCVEDIQTEFNLVQLDTTSDLDKEIATLRNARKIGQLNISSPEIVNLDFLENLEEIGSLFIKDCDNLESISGIGGANVQAYFSLTRCNKLKQLPTFNAITELRGLLISNMEDLEVINGFESLEIAQDIIISNVDALKEIEFEALIDIEEGLGISNCDVLNSIAFNNLVRVGDELVIWRNVSISSLTEFKKLEHVGSMIIIENTMLSNINGLSGVTEVSSIKLHDHQIEDLCLLKNTILSNQEVIKLSIEDANGKRLGIQYFESCN